MGEAPWTSDRSREQHDDQHGGQFTGIGYLEELNAVYKFIRQNENGGEENFFGRRFTITCVPRPDGSYEYHISVDGGKSNRTLAVDQYWRVITYHKGRKDDQCNTGGASSSIQYQ